MKPGRGAFGWQRKNKLALEAGPCFKASAPSRSATYLACIDSISFVRLATRNCTSPSCPWLICQNRLPQIGMSLLPCAGTLTSPRMALATRADGNFPPSFCLNTVRSVGAVLSASAAGPPPFPSLPWHTAQYVSYICFPDAAEVCFTGTCFTSFFCWAKEKTTSSASTNASISTRFDIKFLLGLRTARYRRYHFDSRKMPDEEP